MDTSYALTSRARIKDRLGITATDFDDLFDSLILAVTDRIERMCNRRFMLATWTNELYDTVDMYDTPRDTILLNNAPVRSIAKVEYKAGTNSTPNWTEFSIDDYDVDLTLGILYFRWLPRGRQNVRVTSTAGYSGYSIGINAYWVFNAVPTGTVNGVNRTFTLPVNASQIVVYADGLRVPSSSYDFTADTDTFTFNDGAQPYSTIAVDYLPSTGTVSIDNPALPMELVEVCEEVVSRIFKKRNAEGRSSETLNESTITWSKEVFTPENLAAVKNYRRASFL
jgi:hypothetical protein